NRLTNNRTQLTNNPQIAINRKIAINNTAIARNTAIKLAENNNIYKKNTQQNNYMIQLASYKNERDAQTGVKKFYSKYQDLFTKEQFHIIKIAFDNNEIYHRVRVGYFSAKENATKICKELKNRKQDCYVVRQK
ncbi:MAG: SPOR domain-containing protein, partial [Pseudomonadota bacterium]